MFCLHITQFSPYHEVVVGENKELVRLKKCVHDWGKSEGECRLE